MMNLNDWTGDDAWLRRVRSYEADVLRQLAKALAWRDLQAARAECDALLADAERRRAAAEKALPGLAARLEELDRDVRRATQAYNEAIMRPEPRAPDDPATRKLDELRAPMREARRAHALAEAELRKATAETERLSNLQANLARIAQPQTPLLDVLGLQLLGDPDKGRRRGRS